MGSVRQLASIGARVLKPVSRVGLDEVWDWVEGGETLEDPGD